MTEQSMLERAAQALELLDSSDYHERQNRDYIEMARAVLLAIREPSEAMHRAGLFAYSQEERGIDGIYSAMIDAALI